MRETSGREARIHVSRITYHFHHFQTARSGLQRHMLELEEAVARILAAVPAVAPESTPLAQAHGRFVAETLRAAVALPGFDNSAVDGYAVRAEDVAAAAADNPVRLRIVGRIAAGETFRGEISRGQCTRIFTGSALRRGADAVVMQEDTRVETNSTDDLLVFDRVRPWENVRFHGEDVKRSAIIA